MEENSTSELTIGDLLKLQKEFQKEGTAHVVEGDGDGTGTVTPE